MVQGFDTIIVGAGSAGSVIARRLVDAGQRVLLLEAGRPDSNPQIHDPALMGQLWGGPDDWDYYTVPQPHAHNRRLQLPRGKVLGGSHSLNAMIYVRCAPQDFDHWAALGNDGWAWRDVLPIYREIENYEGGASELRGTGGLLDVVANGPLHPVQASIIEASTQIGLEHNPDYNGEHLDGVSQQQITLRGGERLSTWRAYAEPVNDGERLVTRTGAWVHRLLLDAAGDTVRAVGVEVERDGQTEEVRAGRVILCAGAIDSPRILLRSGIGPAEELREVGITPVVDRPGVGKNLHDHLLAPVIFATDRREVIPPAPGQSPTQTHTFWTSRPELEVPDTQPINFSVPMYQDGMTGPERAFTLMAGIVTPRSRGSIRLSGPHPHDELLIDLAALEHEDDLRSLEASVAQCREIGAAPALAEGWGAREIYPGPGVQTAAELREYVRERVCTYHHQVGTCAMGVGALAVVDPRLQVIGVADLMVADASIMPTVTTGNTNAPSILIGEQAARFILAG
ncbi:GMC family oxidoreductase N-terminal domain-containing protein [Klugiella xanthotipulae]|uniref:Choline dehydrogenase-like flavoprotein n=1 Tax=Klugiella xanthotipulae TaxID=244735 RepID=A0A543HYU0_9MICO|nr:GMC family oxidoreductase N-terminal domain-containing protein [Klugiella xanthotipulae]TQM63504.1 choline dehydrogenase-like flavoprotein [Klugiella xanthotipulae]